MVKTASNLDDLDKYKNKYFIIYTWNGWDVYLRDNPEIPVAGAISSERPPMSYEHGLAMGQKHLSAAIDFIKIMEDDNDGHSF